MKKGKKRIWIFLLTCLLVLILVCIVFLIQKKEESKEETPSNPVVEEKPKEEPKAKKMSIVMVGDALIHGAVYADASLGNGTYDFSKMFTSIEPIISKYDLRYYNQESIIGGGEPKHYPRLNSPKEIGEDLVSIGFNLVSLANNHSLDQNEAGILYSNDFWKTQENVITAGTYSSFEERNELPVYSQNGITYAFLAYTTKTNGLNVPSGKEYLLNVYDEKQVKSDIEAVKAKGAEVIIVSMHWGDEYTHVPTAEEKEIALYLSSLGVNLIIGSHPHVIQPIAYVGDTLVIYSLGNFISAQKVLGLEKIIGLLVGVEIVVEPDSTVHFENLSSELLYTYYNSKNRDFKVIPFSELTDDILKNHSEIEEEYLEILDREV